MSYDIKKMRIDQEKLSLAYNQDITLSLPSESLLYKVNGRSPVEWIVDQHQDFRPDRDEILVLIKRLIHISIKTSEILESLGKIRF